MKSTRLKVMFASAALIAAVTGATITPGYAWDAIIPTSKEATAEDNAAAVNEVLSDADATTLTINGGSDYTLDKTNKNLDLILNAVGLTVKANGKYKSVNIQDVDTYTDGSKGNKVTVADSKATITVPTGAYGSDFTLTKDGQVIDMNIDGAVNHVTMESAGTLNVGGNGASTTIINTKKSGSTITDAAKSSKVILEGDTNFTLKNGATATSILANNGASKITLEDGSTVGTVTVAGDNNATANLELNGNVKKVKVQNGLAKLVLSGKASDYTVVANTTAEVDVPNPVKIIAQANAHFVFGENASGAAINAYNGAKVTIDNKSKGNITYRDVKGNKYLLPAGSEVKEGVLPTNATVIGGTGTATGSGITASGTSITATTSPLYKTASEANKKLVNEFEKKYADLLKTDLDYSKVSGTKIAEAIKDYDTLSANNSELKSLLAVDYAHLVSAQVLANNASANNTVKAFEQMFENILVDKPDLSTISPEQVTAARAAYNFITKSNPDAVNALANDLKKLEAVEKSMTEYTKKAADDEAITKWRNDNRKALAANATIKTVTEEEVAKALSEYDALVANAKNPSTIYTTLSMDKARLDLLMRGFTDQKKSDDDTAAGQVANAFVEDSHTQHILQAASREAVTVTSDQLKYVMGNYDDLSSDVKAVLDRNGTKVKLDRVQAAMLKASEAQSVFDANAKILKDGLLHYGAKLDTKKYPEDQYFNYNIVATIQGQSGTIAVNKRDSQTEIKPDEGYTYTWVSVNAADTFQTSSDQVLNIATSVTYKPAGSKVTYVSTTHRNGSLPAKETAADTGSNSTSTDTTNK